MYEPIRTPGPRVAAPFESMQIKNLTQFVVNMQSPHANIFAIQDYYRMMRPDMLELRKSLDGVDATAALLPHGSDAWDIASKALTRIQAAYTMLLTMALLSNAILQQHSPGHHILVEDAQHMSNEVLRTSRNACRFRPFGSSAQPFALVAVFITTSDDLARIQAQDLIAEYAGDFAITNWAEVGRLLAARLGLVSPEMYGTDETQLAISTFI